MMNQQNHENNLEEASPLNNGQGLQDDDQPITEEQPNGRIENETREILHQSLVRLGFINFDTTSNDNNTTGAMVSEEHRRSFRRDVYVGIRDTEQNLEFLGRVVEGPFHAPHEVGSDSAITRTTVLHPDRTRFRPTYYVQGTIEVLGQLVGNERLVPTATRPRPYSEIFIFPSDRLQQFLGINGDFNIGQLMGYDDVNVRADITNKNFLPRNVGVFGTVGSGKSNTTQVIIEEAINANWAVIVIDVEGEYVKMNEPTDDATLANILRDQYHINPEGLSDFHVYVPQSGHSEAERPINFKVPIAYVDPFVLGDIMELTEAQARLLEAIIDRARNMRRQGTRTGALGQSVEENNEHNFTLQNLIDGLVPTGQQGSLVPAGTPDVTINTLRSKLIRLGMSGMLDWNGTARIPALPIDDLLYRGRLSVLDVSETDDRSRNIAIAYTLQALFDKVIQTAEGQNMPNGRQRPKVLVVIEEIHTFVSRSNASKMRSVLDNLQIISRRGRKRWMALTLVSQQPGHVPDELFELANTRFIHQLKSVTNLTPVKQTTGGVHEALWTNLPSLAPGQCLLTGAVFKNPLFVQVRPAKSRRMLTS